MVGFALALGAAQAVGAPLGAAAAGRAQGGGAGENIGFWGLIGALVHYTLAGPVVALIPSIDPYTGEVGRQGFAYKNYGTLDVVTSFVGHMAFGVLTGILYGYFHSGGGSGLAF